MTAPLFIDMRLSNASFSGFVKFGSLRSPLFSALAIDPFFFLALHDEPAIVAILEYQISSVHNEYQLRDILKKNIQTFRDTFVVTASGEQFRAKNVVCTTVLNDGILIMQ